MSVGQRIRLILSMTLDLSGQTFTSKLYTEQNRLSFGKMGRKIGKSTLWLRGFAQWILPGTSALTESDNTGKH
jgi:hypothetical protein